MNERKTEAVMLALFSFVILFGLLVTAVAIDFLLHPEPWAKHYHYPITGLRRMGRIWLPIGLGLIGGSFWGLLHYFEIEYDDDRSL